MSASFSSPFSILKDIEELDEVGEDIIAEISEDIICMNPTHILGDLPSVLLPVSSAASTPVFSPAKR